MDNAWTKTASFIPTPPPLFIPFITPATLSLIPKSKFLICALKLEGENEGLYCRETKCSP